VYTQGRRGRTPLGVIRKMAAGFERVGMDGKGT
jgi:hypothetical protein